MSGGKIKTYLGDGVYVGFDGYQIWLITSDGLGETNRIALDPDTYEALLAYVARLKRATEPGREKGDDDGVEYAGPPTTPRRPAGEPNQA